VGGNGVVYKRPDFKALYQDALDDNAELRKAIIAVVLSAGGSVEISDELVASISANDRLVTEADPTKESHHVWVERRGAKH
jgi:hypothetical protein